MLNDIEEKRKNELFRKMDNKTINGIEAIELRDLTKKGIEHLVFNNVGVQ